MWFWWFWTSPFNFFCNGTLSLKKKGGIPTNPVDESQYWTYNHKQFKESVLYPTPWYSKNFLIPIKLVEQIQKTVNDAYLRRVNI